MRGLVIITTLAFLFVFNNADAQRYRDKSNLGNDEMVKFIAIKNGDILELNWEISSTRTIKSVELRKGILNAKSVTWETVKKITDDDNKYIVVLPDLGKVFYKLILTDASGQTNEYEPTFKLKKGGIALL